MVTRGILLTFLQMSASRCNVDLTADNGLYALFLKRGIELNRTVHYAMIGNRHRILAERKSLLSYGRYSGSAVKQAVFGMKM